MAETHIDEKRPKKWKSMKWKKIVCKQLRISARKKIERKPMKRRIPLNILADINPQTWDRGYNRPRFLRQPFSPLRLYVSRLDISEKYDKKKTTTNNRRNHRGDGDDDDDDNDKPQRIARKLNRKQVFLCRIGCFTKMKKKNNVVIAVECSR